MIQITPHMRILVALEPVDFRKGIDGLAALCRQALSGDPFSGTLFVFCFEGFGDLANQFQARVDAELRASLRHEMTRFPRIALKPTACVVMRLALNPAGVAISGWMPTARPL